MKDNVNLNLEAGATFFLSQDKDVFIPGALSMIYEKDAKDKRTKNALEIENVKGLRIAYLTIDWDEEHVEEKWQSALVMKKVSDFEIVSFKGRQRLKNSDNPAIETEDTSDGLIRDSKAIEGCGTFVSFKGIDTKEIEVRNSN